MLYRFRVNVVIRVILLTLAVMVLVAGYNRESLVLLMSGSALVFVVLYSLFYYVDQTNRDVNTFLSSIQYNDFTATSSARHRGKSFGELYDGFNLIYRKFQEVRADREANHQFLQTIVEHIDVGLLCFNEDGEVRLMNKALQRMLHKSFLLHVDGLEQISEDLWKAVKGAEPGQRELLKVTVDNRLQQLALQATQLRLQNESLILVSIQNIESELETRELEAWQKLIRILTHEIMNSVAPITSLSGTIHQMLEGEEPPASPRTEGYPRLRGRHPPPRRGAARFHGNLPQPDPHPAPQLPGAGRRATATGPGATATYRCRRTRGQPRAAPPPFAHHPPG